MICVGWVLTPALLLVPFTQDVQIGLEIGNSLVDLLFRLVR